MLSRYGKLSLAVLSLTALGLVAVPQGAYAQDAKGDTDTSATDKQNQPIDLRRRRTWHATSSSSEKDHPQITPITQILFRTVGLVSVFLKQSA